MPRRNKAVQRLFERQQETKGNRRIGSLEDDQTMKETTIDYVLGRVLRINAFRWRVLELDRKGRLRVLCLDDGTFGVFDWAQTRDLIAESRISVE